MGVLNRADLDFVIAFAAAVVTDLLTRRTGLPVTALEIPAGIALPTVLGLSLSTPTDSVLGWGAGPSSSSHDPRPATGSSTRT